jgi:hypothetical protein
MFLLIIVTRSLSRLSLAACDWVSLSRRPKRMLLTLETLLQVRQPDLGPSRERTCDDVLGSLG